MSDAQPKRTPRRRFGGAKRPIVALIAIAIGLGGLGAGAGMALGGIGAAIATPHDHHHQDADTDEHRHTDEYQSNNARGRASERHSYADFRATPRD